MTTAAPRIIAPIAVGAIMLGLWFLVVDVLHTAPRALPSPVAIVGMLTKHSDIILEDMGITATNALIGLLVGTVLAILLPALAATFRPVDGMLSPLVAALASLPDERLGDEAEIYGALVTGLRAYVAKNGFRSVLIGLSGGIDSALGAALACDAIGAEHV